MIGMLAGLLIARNPAMTLPHARRLAKVGLAVAAFVLLVVGFLIWDHFDDKAAVEADRSASKAEAVSRARDADGRAGRAADDTRDAIERSNADAKAAADRSDDPLATALDRLRAGTDRDR
jgi:hypothetical protein